MLYCGHLVVEGVLTVCGEILSLNLNCYGVPNLTKVIAKVQNIFCVAEYLKGLRESFLKLRKKCQNDIFEPYSDVLCVNIDKIIEGITKNQENTVCDNL